MPKTTAAGEPFSWERECQPFQITVKEGQDWVQKVFDRIDPLTKIIWTRKRYERSAFALGIDEQKELLLLRQWEKKNFFYISLYLSEAVDHFDLEDVDGDLTVPINGFETAAIYVWMRTHGKELDPTVLKLLTAKESLPKDGRLTYHCVDEYGQNVEQSFTYEAARRNIFRDFRLPERAGLYTPETLRRSAQHLPHGNRTYFNLDLSESNPELKIYQTDLVNGTARSPIQASQAAEWAQRHKRKTYRTQKDYHEFVTNFINDRICYKDWSTYRQTKKEKLKNLDNGDPEWTSPLRRTEE